MICQIEIFQFAELNCNAMAAQVFVKSAIRIKSELGVKGVHIINGKVEVPNRIGRRFKYDYTLGPEKSQADVYTQRSSQWLSNFLNS